MALHSDPRKFYKALGVSPFVTQGELKRAWRQRALEWHPDRNAHPEAKRVFQLLQEAWAVLGDAERRAAYDRVSLRYVA